MLAFRPQVQARDPRESGPDDVVLDGEVIGTVKGWHPGSGPMFIATLNLGRGANGVIMPSGGSGTSPELAVLDALAKGVADHATGLARARALEARICGAVPA